MRVDINYSPSDCVETFPFLEDAFEPLAPLGRAYRDHRAAIMAQTQRGLTFTYNHFHDPTKPALDIQTLRDLHSEMDRAVASAYGWDDLDLGHGFHETKQGTRFTISEPARLEVLQRLIELNHQRYAEEVAQGLHEKGAKKRKKPPAERRAKPSSSGDEQQNLFD